MGGFAKGWIATAGVLAALLSFYATGSAAAKQKPQSAPVNTALPTISGAPIVGATLGGNAGTWTGSRRYSYQWLDCDGSGGNCAPINGATGTQWTVTGSQLGSTLRLSVVAFSRAGSTSATSVPTADVSQDTTGGGGSSTPDAPTGLSAANPTASAVTLSWSASNGSDPATGYDVYVNGTQVATPTGTSSTVGNLACAKSYTFAVDAHDAAGNKSAQVSVNASTAACPSSSDRIYWGAWIEGQQTYSYLYGGTWGNAPWDSNTLARFDQNTGKHPSIIHWGMSPAFGHDFSYWAGTLNLVQNAGALNLIDISTGNDSLAAIANGSRDAYWNTFAQQAAAYGKPFFLRFDWEMNGSWFPWGTTSSNQNTPASYVAAWRHVHDIFTAAGAGNVTWVWCPNLAYGGSVPYSQLYPGDAYVNWTCLDGYNKASSTESFSSLYSQSYQNLLNVAPTKPIMIGEVGSVEYGAGVKATWIANMLSELPTNFPKVKALVWFNWRDGDDYEIESSASSQAAFAAGIASPYYAAAGSFATPPSLAAIAPPG